MFFSAQKFSMIKHIKVHREIRTDKAVIFRENSRNDGFFPFVCGLLRDV